MRLSRDRDVLLPHSWQLSDVADSIVNSKILEEARFCLLKLPRKRLPLPALTLAIPSYSGFPFLRPRCQCPWITSSLWPLAGEASLMMSISSFCRSGWSFSSCLAQSLKSFARRSNAWGHGRHYRLCCRVIEHLTCGRHACMISSGGWSARSARRLGSARQRPCSSLPRGRASRRRKTKRKSEIRLPLLPQQRTCGDCIGRSVLCQFRTCVIRWQ